MAIYVGVAQVLVLIRDACRRVFQVGVLRRLGGTNHFDPRRLPSRDSGFGPGRRAEPGSNLKLRLATASVADLQNVCAGFVECQPDPRWGKPSGSVLRSPTIHGCQAASLWGKPSRSVLRSPTIHGCQAASRWGKPSGLGLHSPTIHGCQAASRWGQAQWITPRDPSDGDRLGFGRSPFRRSFRDMRSASRVAEWRP